MNSETHLSSPHFFTDELPYFASCSKYLEPLLEQELVHFGLRNRPNKDFYKTNTLKETNGISFTATFDKVLHFMVETRIASRLLMKLGSFRVKNDKNIYSKAQSIPWEAWFSYTNSIKIHTLLAKHKINTVFPIKNSLYISQVIKDAICDRFREKYANRPNVSLNYPDIQVYSYIKAMDIYRYQMDLYLDISGLLSNRGYRKETSQAPLRENLAAAIVQLCDWDTEKQPFIDSMCGSGTLLIEAALIKGRIPPSIFPIQQHIKYPFENLIDVIKHPDHQAHIEHVKNQVKQKYSAGIEALKKQKQPIIGYDIAGKMVQLAKTNIQRMGLHDVIQVYHKDATTIPAPSESSIIVCNPPYGERMGTTESVNQLYYEYTEHLKKHFKHSTAYILTSASTEPRKHIRLQTSRRIPLFNSNIECRLYEYKLF